MAEYIDRNKIPWAKVDNPKGIFWERIVFESAINNIPPADVIEREKVKSLIEVAIEDGWELDYTLERLKEI
jgi:hypothetical protein